jgi:hypothetical protein
MHRGVMKGAAKYVVHIGEQVYTVANQEDRNPEVERG